MQSLIFEGDYSLVVFCYCPGAPFTRSFEYSNKETRAMEQETVLQQLVNISLSLRWHHLK